MRIALLLALLVSVPALAQTPEAQLAGASGEIAGTVTDAETGEALPGANVIMKGTTLGAATNIDGEFVLRNVPTGVYRIDVHYSGFMTAGFDSVRVTP